ncbi:F-box protein SKIP23-like [Rutidosis leptorrhynchoides]|uniref:F-box protein SKIP23-like n=1 Tax=Rutidosis leptorrhynchoides TaxID=125765 RepID=UPI003A9A4CB1
MEKSYNDRLAMCKEESRQHLLHIQEEHATVAHQRLRIAVHKAVVSTNPWNLEAQHYNSNCVVMMIYGLLTFTRSGHEAWIDVVMPSYVRRCPFSDIIYCRNRFYAVNAHYDVIACSIDDRDVSIVTRVAYIPSYLDMLSTKYLVELSGELLMICRNYSYDRTIHPETMTRSFEVLKLIKDEETGYEFVKFESLDDHALFVGQSASFSLSASNMNRCEGNCIYFIDDYSLNYTEKRGSGSDMGVYNFEDEKIEPFYSGQSLSYFSSPLWYI